MANVRLLVEEDGEPKIAFVISFGEIVKAIGPQNFFSAMQSIAGLEKWFKGTFKDFFGALNQRK